MNPQKVQLKENMAFLGHQVFPHLFLSVCLTVKLNACVKDRMFCSCWKITWLFIHAGSHCWWYFEAKYNFWKWSSAKCSWVSLVQCQQFVWAVWMLHWKNNNMAGRRTGGCNWLNFSHLKQNSNNCEDQSQFIALLGYCCLWKSFLLL